MPSLKGRRILLIEDELLIALDLQMTLEKEGASVVLADGVATGLAAASRQEANGSAYDIALLDVRLNDGEVFPVADRLSAGGVPIVFHSGHAQGIDLARGYPQAIVLSKPAPPDRLLAALETQIGRAETVP